MWKAEAQNGGRIMNLEVGCIGCGCLRAECYFIYIYKKEMENTT